MTDVTSRRDRFGAWCGWVMIGAAALTPLLIWLSPISFAGLLALMGLLCLPALRLSGGDRLLAAVLLLGLLWAAISTTWSPYRPAHLDANTGLKLALELVLYGSAWCGARRASASGARAALVVLAWGLAGLGLLMLAEAYSGAAVYRTLREALHDPIDFPSARKNIAQGAFVLALLWPATAAGAVRAGASWLLAVPMAIGMALMAHVFLADAPVMALGLALGAGALVWLRPKSGPQILALGGAAAVLLMPLATLVIQAQAVRPQLPLSWSERVDYWIYAVDRIGEHPLRGWGLDASRTFSPHIQLHPHNGSLQLWLELGAPGAAIGALVIALAIRRLAADSPNVVTAGGAASWAVYMLFGMVSFGVWQEWWLALGALTAVILALGATASAAAPGARPGTMRQGRTAG